MSIDQWVDKEDVVHIHNGILLSHKMSETGPFVEMWMDLEYAVHSETSQKRKTNVTY